MHGKSRRLRRAVVAAALALVVCFGLLAGTTLAWFTDSVSSTGNKIQAGTLDIALEELGADGQFAEVGEDPIFSYALWEPGYSEYAVLRVANKGSLALEWQMNIVPNGEAGILGDAIDVYALVSEGTAITETPTDLAAALEAGYTKVGTLNELIADADGAAYGVLYASDAVPAGGCSEAYAGIILHMREDAGNEYQGLSLGSSFDILLSATQYTYEEDGFGDPSYDGDAEYDAILTQEGALAALSDPEATQVDIQTNMVAEGYDYHAYIISDKTVDFHGKTFTKPDASGSGLRIGYDPTNYEEVPSTVTIENGHFVGVRSAIAVVRVETGSNATFNDCIFDGEFQSYMSNVTEDTEMTLEFNNCTFTKKVRLESGSADAKMTYNVTFNNCTYETETTAVELGHYAGGTFAFNDCTMTVNAGESNGAAGIKVYANTDDVTLDFTDTDITFVCSGNGVAAISLSNSDNAATVRFTRSNVTMVGDGNGSAPVTASAAGDDTAELVIDAESVFLLNGETVEFKGWHVYPEWQAV